MHGQFLGFCSDKVEICFFWDVALHQWSTGAQCFETTYWSCLQGSDISAVAHQHVRHPSPNDVVPHSRKMETLELRINVNE